MAINNEYANIFKFFILFSFTVYLNAYNEIKSFRLIQYENSESALFGSQYSNLNYIGAYYKGDTLRKISLVPLNDLTETKEIDNVLKSNANSILFIIPRIITGAVSQFVEYLQLTTAERLLYIPVYFTYETDEIVEIVAQLKDEYERANHIEKNKSLWSYLGMQNNLLHFSISISEPKKLETVNLENFYGYLEGSNSEGQNSIIAIVANYDSFGIAPDLPSGMNSNGSGMIALLELMRVLSKFYENYDNVLKYDLLFILTSAGNLNYEGTQHFINNLDSSIIKNIDFVLCLDSLGKSEDLNLHISRFPKEMEESAVRLYRIFNSTSDNMEKSLKYIRKKIYLQNKNVPWEHEQFSKKKILSATLSGLEKPISNIFNKTNILDTKIEKTVLKNNIKFLAESLLSFLFDYDIKNFTIFKDDETLLDDNNLDSYITYLGKISRFPNNIQKLSVINNDIFNFMNNYLQKSQRQSFEYTQMKFYDSNSGVIKIFSVKSKLIDLYLLFIILFYLFAVYVYSKGLGNFMRGLRSSLDGDDE